MMIILVACVASTARDQVNSAPSPDGEVNAVLFETNGGATTSFGYEVELRDTHDQRHRSSSTVPCGMRKPGELIFVGPKTILSRLNI